MTSNFDAENAKKIIYDSENTNVTETNQLRDFLYLSLKLIVIILCLYLFVFIISGVVLSSLSIEKQIAIENFLSPSVSEDVEKISAKDNERLKKVKANILKADKNFPKTSNLDIGIIKDEHLNALCYPNGTIYITSELYKYLDTDEKLTFVIAHEMGHYRHKDHLLNLRQSLANSVILITLSIVNPNGNKLGTLVESSLDVSDLKYSRGVEANADKYAVQVMNEIYGNAKAGVEVMKTFKEGNSFDIEFLSTHPNLDKRIKYIEEHSN